MSAPTITSISPSSGPLRTVITLTGTGFVPGAQVGCPALTPTTYVSATMLTCMVPAELQAAPGTMAIGVFVMNPDGGTSNVALWSLVTPATALQGWTTVDAVASEIPGFARGGQIDDGKIQGWIANTAQTVKAVMLRRGFSLNPADWAQVGTDGTPEAYGALENMNRLGAAARLAAAAASLFTSGEMGFAKRLQASFDGEIQALENGRYDHLFRASGAATEETGPGFASGDMTDGCGNSTSAFGKTQVF